MADQEILDGDEPPPRQASATETPSEDIRSRRLALRLTQEELGNAAGVHRVTIRSVERGNPSTEATRIGIEKALSQFERARRVTTPLTVGDDTLACALHDLLCPPGVEADADHRKLDAARAQFVRQRMRDHESTI